MRAEGGGGRCSSNTREVQPGVRVQHAAAAMVVADETGHVKQLSVALLFQAYVRDRLRRTGVSRKPR